MPREGGNMFNKNRMMAVRNKEEKVLMIKEIKLNSNEISHLCFVKRADFKICLQLVGVALEGTTFTS